jgi:hypothetical protein
MPTRNLSTPFRELERLVIEWFFYNQFYRWTFKYLIGRKSGLLHHLRP